MSAFLRKYNTATAAGTHIRVPVIKAGSNDYAINTDWTPAAGDVKICKDGGAEANIDTLPSYSNGAWEFQLTGAELSAKTIHIKVVDSATKAVEDQFIIIETFGNASAMYPVDMSDLNAQADILLKRDWSGITGEASRSMLNAMRHIRNKWSISGTTKTVFKEDDSTTAWTSTITVTAGADLITGDDPA